MAFNRASAVAGLVLVCGLAMGQTLSPFAPEAVKQPPAKGSTPAQPAPKGPQTPQAPAITATPEERANWPKITFAETEVQFGKISDENPIMHEFKFKNEGKTPLELGQINGSCGCTVPTLEKKTYQPGEEGVIKVTFNPAHKRGPTHTTVTVNSNDPASPSLTLNILSDVTPLVSLEPLFLNFGNVERNTPAKQTARFVTRVPGLTIAAATIDDPDSTVTLLPTEETKEGDATVYTTPIEISIPGTDKIGTWQHRLTVRTSDEKRQPMIATVMGEVVGEIEATPRNLTLGGRAPGDHLEGKLVIRARKPGTQFNILGVKAQPAQGGNFLQFTPSRDPANDLLTYVVDVEGTSPTNPGAFRGDIVVTTDMKGQEEIRVPYVGFVRDNRAQAPQGLDPRGGQNPNDPWLVRPSSLMPH